MSRPWWSAEGCQRSSLPCDPLLFIGVRYRARRVGDRSRLSFAAPHGIVKAHCRATLAACSHALIRPVELPSLSPPWRLPAAASRPNALRRTHEPLDLTS